MEASGAVGDEISARVRTWCESRAPTHDLQHALLVATTQAQRANRKYEKVYMVNLLFYIFTGCHVAPGYEQDTSGFVYREIFFLNISLWQ